jgi:molybdate transport system ATP-binding protein
LNADPRVNLVNPVGDVSAGLLYTSISCAFGDQFNLHIEISVAPGITILLGPSGAGKTTLLDCLAGLRRPDSGRIVAGGETLFDDEQKIDLPTQRRRCGYLFQTLALFPHMTARENVEYGMHHLPREERQRKSEKILQSFRISELGDRKPGQVSGGERQRVALARALVTEPRFLLLDEPLTALDAATKSRIIDDLRDWNRVHNIPILYVTHERREAYALGDRVIVLESGAVIAEGTPQEVLDSPQRETVAQLAGFENVFQVRVESRHDQDGTLTCELLPPKDSRSRVVLEKFFRESGIGGGLQLPASGAPAPKVTLEVPLVRAELGEQLQLGIRAGDILLSLERPTGLSARNLIAARIDSVRREGSTIVVEASSAEDHSIRFVAHLTPRAVQSMNLKKEDLVWLVVKSHSCHLLR